MNERKALWERIKNADQSSRQLWEQWDAASGDQEYCAILIRNYIREKFLMSDLPEDTESIYELGRRSFVKLQKMKEDGLLGDEINTGCSGASTEIARKALFFMALQRDLKMTFLPEDITDTETVADVISLCWNYKQVKAGSFWKKENSEK